MPVPLHVLFSLRYNRQNRLLAVVGFNLLIIYNEWFSYTMYSWSWPTLPAYEDSNLAQSANRKNQVKILLVADPQIVGIQDEHWLFGYLTRWDCDRYLTAGYRRALSHTNPTIVVFLGDLIDEGSQASESEFESYVTRFNRIFYVPHNVKTLYASGDNDVGGEGMDPKERWKQERFFQKIPEPSQRVDDIRTQVHFLTFIRLSYDNGEMLDENQLKKLQAVRNQSNSQYTVVCNHMPISTRLGNTHKKVLHVLKPNVVFSAHNHEGSIARCSMCRDTEEESRRFQQADNSKDGQGQLGRGYWSGDVKRTDDWAIHSMDMEDPYIMHEITVPTCSYRMGVKNMGYGYATIDSDGILRYTVLWLPGRYTQLYSYAIFLIITTLLLVSTSICRRCRRALL